MPGLLKPAGKAQKAKATKEPQKAKSALSAEFVQDSDDEGNTAPKKTPSKPLKRQVADSTTSQAVGLSRTPKPIPNKSKRQKTPSSSSDTETFSISGRKTQEKSDVSGFDESETGSSSGSEGPAPAKRDPIPKSLAKSKPSVPIIEESSGTDDSDGGSEKDRSGGSESGKSDESRNSGESESESESDSQARQKTSELRANGRQGVSATQEQILPYEPPTDFEAMSISFPPSSATNKIFAPANLEGKQIWHITTPASISMASVKEIPAHKVQDGSSILSHNGTDYGLVPDTAESAASEHALLFPSGQSNEYRSISAEVMSTLHLRQVLTIPTHAVDSSLVPSKPRNIQPKGLKMRYRPFGLSSSSESDSDSERPTETHKVRPPPSSKKRRHAEIEQQRADGEPNHLKSKKATSKSRRSSSPVQGSPMAIDDASDDDETHLTAASPIKKRKDDNATTPLPLSSQSHPQQSEETKSARKKTERRANKDRPKPDPPSSANPSSQITSTTKLQTAPEENPTNLPQTPTPTHKHQNPGPSSSPASPTQAPPNNEKDEAQSKEKAKPPITPSTTTKTSPPPPASSIVKRFSHKRKNGEVVFETGEERRERKKRSRLVKEKGRGKGGGSDE